MKSSYKNINLRQRQSNAKERNAALKWIKQLRKVGGMTRKLRRDR